MPLLGRLAALPLWTALALCLLLCAPAPAAAKNAGKPTRVAFVLLDSIDDQGWTTAHHDGIEHLKRTLGGAVQISYTERVKDPAKAEQVFRDYARQGYDLIFGTTFEHMEPLYAVAAEFPKTAFMHCAGFKTRPNLGTYMVRIEQSEYLAGYLAGLMGFRNVGTVATVPIPEVIRGINAFTLGLARGLAESGTAHDAGKINTVVWLNSWRDAEHETSLAEALAAAGHDLIREMADTSESSRAACAKGVAAIGYGTDSTRFGAGCALTSTTFEWGPVYVETVKRLRAGVWSSEPVFTGFESGSVGLAPFGKAVPADVARKVLALKARMVHGRDRSFQGPIVDQAGQERIGAGRKATDAELLSMDWLVRGVSGALPR